MEKKKKLNNWQPKYPVVDAKEEGLDTWFKNNHYTTGIAEGREIELIVEKVNSSKAPFVQRLKDQNRNYIQDWADNRYIATHKLSVGTDHQGNSYIYPEVQEIDGKLIDFTRPPYAPWAGMISAEERGDTVRVPSIEQGVRFTENYKKHYPKGNTFVEGGPKYKKSEQAYYDKNTDTVYAPDSIGEFYQHEMFHARHDSAELKRLRPYYDNLNDDKLFKLGADFPFVKRINNDPGFFYSPEELGARVKAARHMLNSAGIKSINSAFLKEARKNENAYGNNFRDLLHMYNDNNLIGIFGNSYSYGGHIYDRPKNSNLTDRAQREDEAYKYNIYPTQLPEITIKPKYQLGGFLRRLATRTINKGIDLAGKALVKGTRKLIRRPQSNTTRQSINDVIDLARNGNAKAIQQLKQYGIEPGNPGVYRFISQEEADNILKGGRYAGRFNDGRVDVTANPNGTTAANSSFRITFKPEFDLYKPSQRVRMKNSELQDGWIMDGYGLDDVATIERRLPNGNYEPYKGQITITPQNTGSMTPELWTAAQDAAIARGDIAEAQRLRDLHFKVKSQTKILDEDGNVLPSFHYSENKFTEFNPDKIGVNDPGFYGKGFYSSPNKNYASTYGENEYKLYINSKEPFKTNNNEDRSLSAFSFNRTDESPLIDIDNLNLRKELENADAVWQKGVAPIRGDKPIEEIVVTKPTQMKLADAITYDNGVRIPLGERDNFNIKDIRYGLIPFVGLAGLTLKNNK